MRKLLITSTILTSIALGLWSGHQIGISAKASIHEKEADYVWVDLPTFVATVNTDENHSTHIRIDTSVSVNSDYAENELSEDRILDAVIQATVQFFDAKNLNHESDTLRLERIAAKASDLIGDDRITSLRINRLASYELKSGANSSSKGNTD